MSGRRQTHVVEDARVCRIVRALRRRRGWRQVDLGRKSGLSQATISLVERSHLSSLSLRSVRGILRALDAEATIDVRWRGAALDRLLDERHARLVGRIVEILKARWEVATEVTYARYGERGSFDVLALHPPTGAVLVVEVKSELASVEATLRKLDEKVRLAPIVARERFGRSPATVSRLVVLPDSSTERARVARAANVLDLALPARGVAVRTWLDSPGGSIAGLRFLQSSNGRSAKSRCGNSRQVSRAAAGARDAATFA